MQWRVTGRTHFTLHRTQWKRRLGSEPLVATFCLYLFSFKSVIRVVIVFASGMEPRIPQSQCIGIISLSNNSIRTKPMAPSHLSKTHYRNFVRVIAAIVLHKNWRGKKDTSEHSAVWAFNLSPRWHAMPVISTQLRRSMFGSGGGGVMWGPGMS